MILMSSAELTLFADSLNVPRGLGVPFAKRVASFYRNNGTKWTVSYLKTLYTDFVRFVAGQPLVGTWYRKGRDGIPAGCFRPLFLRGKSQEHRFAVTQLLRCYTAAVSPTLQPEQWEKFSSGVSAEPVDVLPIHSEMLALACEKLNLSLSYGNPSPYYAYNPSCSRKVPDPSGKSLPEETDWIGQHRFTKTIVGQGLIHRFQPLFSVVLPHDLDHQVEPSFPNVVGKIGFIQEPGYKLRAVANPNRVFQHALEPLKKGLLDLIRTLPWDCTHDQFKAVPFVQEHLKRKQDVYCVDLSGATDYFPLHLQETVLTHITKNDTLGQLKLFLQLSREQWLLPNGSFITWTKGQPLGLGPSFMSFALTHGLVLFSLNGYRHEEKFFVLGDDVVILDKSLHRRYLDFLSYYRCPISEHKSIVSSDLAEFAGLLISESTVVKQLKWRQISDDSFLDVMRNLGYHARRLLLPRQKEIFDKVAYIPDFLGGCGFNPKGLPLAERIARYFELIRPDNSSYLLSLSERMSAYFYGIRGVPPVLWTNSFLRTFDQKVALHVLAYLLESQGLLRHLALEPETLGKNLRTVQPRLGLPVVSNVRRTTLLQRLELML